MEGYKIKPSAMNRIPILILTAVLAAAIMLFANSLAAQDAPVGGQAASVVEAVTPGLTLAEVEAGLAAVEADTGIEDAAKNQLRSKYKQAIEALKEVANFAAQAEDYREAIKTAREKAAELRARLKALPSTESAAKIAPTGSTENLQKTVDSQRAALKELNDGLSKITSEIARVKERPIEISSRLPKTQREMQIGLRYLDSVHVSMRGCWWSAQRGVNPNEAIVRHFFSVLLLLLLFL
jgi:uncharacterized phage infection (PIP) family protein YhgE